MLLVFYICQIIGSIWLFCFFQDSNIFLWSLVQDNFSRLHDRSKETPKTMKQLNRLFPNKVVIQLPQVLSQIFMSQQINQCFCLLSK